MFRFAVPLILILAVVPATSAAPTQSRIEQDADRCRDDPRFRIGGAMIGDCLMELSVAVDGEIHAAMREGETRYCLAEDRADYRRIQEEWQTYRQSMCDLVERSPNNTPSWVNSAACHLELGRQRLAALRYTNEYGSPRCPVD